MSEITPTFERPSDIIPIISDTPSLVVVIDDFMPRSAPRPRAYRGRVSNPSWYREYKKVMGQEIIEYLSLVNGYECGIYSTAIIVFGFPYPKTMKKGEPRTESAIVSKNSVNKDNDNLVKGVLDVLQECGVMKNDKDLSITLAVKVRTQFNPFIKIFLYQ